MQADKKQVGQVSGQVEPASQQGRAVAQQTPGADVPGVALAGVRAGEAQSSQQVQSQVPTLAQQRSQSVQSQQQPTQGKKPQAPVTQVPNPQAGGSGTTEPARIGGFNSPDLSLRDSQADDSGTIEPTRSDPTSGASSMAWPGAIEPAKAAIGGFNSPDSSLRDSQADSSRTIEPTDVTQKAVSAEAEQQVTAQASTPSQPQETVTPQATELPVQPQQPSAQQETRGQYVEQEPIEVQVKSKSEKEQEIKTEGEQIPRLRSGQVQADSKQDVSSVGGADLQPLRTEVDLQPEEEAKAGPLAKLGEVFSRLKEKIVKSKSEKEQEIKIDEEQIPRLRSGQVQAPLSGEADKKQIRADKEEIRTDEQQAQAIVEPAIPQPSNTSPLSRFFFFFKQKFWDIGRLWGSSLQGKAKIIAVVLLAFIPLYWLFRYLGEPTVKPRNVYLSNLTDRSFTISWVTFDQPTKGYVITSEKDSFPPIYSNIFGNRSKDERDELVEDWYKVENVANRYWVHIVHVVNLKPETDYYFRVGSGNKLYAKDVKGEEFGKVRTFASLEENGAPQPAYGRILTKEGDENVDGALVYMQLERKGEKSTLLSGLTKENGTWTVDKANARTSNGNLFAKLSAKDKETLWVEADARGTAKKFELDPTKDQPAENIKLDGIRPKVKTGFLSGVWIPVRNAFWGLGDVWVFWGVVGLLVIVLGIYGFVGTAFFAKKGEVSPVVKMAVVGMMVMGWIMGPVLMSVGEVSAAVEEDDQVEEGQTEDAQEEETPAPSGGGMTEYEEVGPYGPSPTEEPEVGSDEEGGAGMPDTGGGGGDGEGEPENPSDGDTYPIDGGDGEPPETPAGDDEEDDSPIIYGPTPETPEQPKAPEEPPETPEEEEANAAAGEQATTPTATSETTVDENFLDGENAIVIDPKGTELTGEIVAEYCSECVTMDANGNVIDVNWNRWGEKYDEVMNKTGNNPLSFYERSTMASLGLKPEDPIHRDAFGKAACDARATCELKEGESYLQAYYRDLNENPPAYDAKLEAEYYKKYLTGGRYPAGVVDIEASALCFGHRDDCGISWKPRSWIDPGSEWAVKIFQLQPDGSYLIDYEAFYAYMSGEATGVKPFECAGCTNWESLMNEYKIAYDLYTNAQMAGLMKGAEMSKSVQSATAVCNIDASCTSHVAVAEFFDADSDEVAPFASQEITEEGLISRYEIPGKKGVYDMVVFVSNPSIDPEQQQKSSIVTIKDSTSGDVLGYRVTQPVEVEVELQDGSKAKGVQWVVMQYTYSPSTSGFDVRNLFVGTVHAQSSQNGSDFQVALFIDKNKNGQFDGNDEMLTTQNSDIQVATYEIGRTYDLKVGWNFVSFPFVKDDYFASDLLADIASQGGYATTVSTYYSGKWYTYKQRGATAYSDENFNITPGRGYAIRVHETVEFTAAGNSPGQSVPIDFVKGWNLIGVHPGYTDDGQTAIWQHSEGNDGWMGVEFMDALRAAGMEATVVTDYRSGRYVSVIKDEDASGETIVYGDDYEMEETKGYFVKVDELGGEAKFAP